MSGTFIGTSLSISAMTVPSLLLTHPSASKEVKAMMLENATRSWKYIYDVGKKVGPMAGLVGSCGYVYAAQALPSDLLIEKRMLYAAAVANMLVGPFTMLIMQPTNDELIRRANAASAGKVATEASKNVRAGSIESYDIPKLIQRWSKLNAARSIFPVAAAVLAATALASAF